MTEKLPKWTKDPRELEMVAQWPEDWRVYHKHGLEWLLASGQVEVRLFTEELGSDASNYLGCLPGRDDEASWFAFVAGRLLAGVGAELLIKGVFLKAGFSLRNPARREDAVARLGSAEAKRLNPRLSVSFGQLLSATNLSLLERGDDLLPLMVAKWWRDQAAHSAVLMTGDAGVHLVRLALALRQVHERLLTASDEEHAANVAEILRRTTKVFGRGA